TRVDLFMFVLIVAGGWWALYRPMLARPHYRWWAWGWTAFLVFLAGARASVALPPDDTTTALVQAPAGMAQIACFALGAEALRRGEDVGRRWRRSWLAAAVAAGLGVGLVLLGIEDERANVTAGTLARSPGLAVAFAYCAWVFLRRERGRGGVAVWAIAGGFLLYGVDQAVYTAASAREALAMLAGGDAGAFGIGVVLSETFFLADIAWEACIGVGALLLLVDEKDRLHRESLRNRRRFEALFEHSGDGILVVDADGRIRAANPAASEMVGAGRDDLDGRTLLDLFADDAALPSGPSDVAGRAGLSVETVCRSGSGDEFPVELTISAYEVDGTPAMQVLLRDVSTRRALMDRLEHRATHDPLTDLPNRQYVFDELSRALAMMERDEARPAVLFLDLDQFKEVNDTYGHAAGDELLVAVADRLRDTVRETELVGHFGGDEFVLVLHWCESEEDLRGVGRRIADAIAEPFRAGGRELELTASIGGALARPGDGPDELIRRADAAMYRAKASAGGEAGRVAIGTAG
ncbi:MAG: diguanylate cyclase domain-containing protein, partial [Gemmatimonadota bacterium]